MVFYSTHAPNRGALRPVREWLADHPGSTLEEVAEALFPGKITGPGRVEELLRYLLGTCQVRRDGDRWWATG